jgi:hypothetical protein
MTSSFMSDVRTCEGLTGIIITLSLMLADGCDPRICGQNYRRWHSDKCIMVSWSLIH